MKRKILGLFVVILVLILCLGIIACKDNDAENDDDYTIEIYGLTENPITITKGQIKEMGQTKEVVYTEEQPCYASDKTDDDNNLIPHTLKGVYLDDLLQEYADEAVSGAYSSMILKAHDGYETVLTQETYSVEHGGAKMIIAYEYDGIILKENEKSGALRAVFPNKEANSWAKMLKSIHFTDAQLSLPEAETLNFIELLDEKYNSSFQSNENIGGQTITYTYYGISLNELFEDEILKAEENDKMYITAWDYITNGTDYFYRDYTNWKSYEYYENAFLIFSQKEGDGDIEPYDLSPKFDGANILKGMAIKNVLSLSVSSAALMSLDIAFEKFDDEDNNSVDLEDILQHINMYDEDNDYTITDMQDNDVQFDSEMIAASYLTKEGDSYILHYGSESTLTIKSITKN